MRTGFAEAHPPAEDLDRAGEELGPAWGGLKDARIFLTGGTGFFGAWLLETLLWANRRLGLGARATLLTRDEEGFRRRFPRLAGDPAVALTGGDVRDFRFPGGAFTHVVQAAADASPRPEDAAAARDVIVLGTRRTLAFASEAGARRVLFVSSGAVYGPQPAGITHLPEDFAGRPAPGYGEGKLAAEREAAEWSAKSAVPVAIARCFAFSGPYLPLDRQFALGNFVRDALSGGPVRVAGDGSPFRSYLYGADLAVWLWKILLEGAPGRPYNVGSEDRRTIADVAGAVAREAGVSVETARKADPSAPAAQYVPSTARARRELGLRETVGFAEGVRRMIRWYSGNTNG